MPLELKLSAAETRCDQALLPLPTFCHKHKPLLCVIGSYLCKEKPGPENFTQWTGSWRLLVADIEGCTSRGYRAT